MFIKRAQFKFNVLTKTDYYILNIMKADVLGSRSQIFMISIPRNRKKISLHQYYFICCTIYNEYKCIYFFPIDSFKCVFPASFYFNE